MLYEDDILRWEELVPELAVCWTAVQTVIGTSSVVLNGITGGQALPVRPPPFPAQADPFARVAYSNRSTEQDIKDKGISAEVNWETPWLGGAVLTSITAQRDWQAINGLDYDFSAADVLYRNANADESLSRFETFSQELRLTGSTDKIDWMVGMFYADEDLTRNETYRIGPHYEPYVSTLSPTWCSAAWGRSWHRPSRREPRWST